MKGSRAVDFGANIVWKGHDEIFIPNWYDRESIEELFGVNITWECFYELKNRLYNDGIFEDINKLLKNKIGNIEMYLHERKKTIFVITDGEMYYIGKCYFPKTPTLLMKIQDEFSYELSDAYPFDTQEEAKGQRDYLVKILGCKFDYLIVKEVEA